MKRGFGICCEAYMANQQKKFLKRPKSLDGFWYCCNTFFVVLRQEYSKRPYDTDPYSVKSPTRITTLPILRIAPVVFTRICVFAPRFTMSLLVSRSRTGIIVTPIGKVTDIVVVASVPPLHLGSTFSTQNFHNPYYRH